MNKVIFLPKPNPTVTVLPTAACMLQQPYGFKNGDVYRFYRVVNNKKHFVNTNI